LNYDHDSYREIKIKLERKARKLKSKGKLKEVAETLTKVIELYWKSLTGEIYTSDSRGTISKDISELHFEIGDYKKSLLFVNRAINLSVKDKEKFLRLSNLLKLKSEILEQLGYRSESQFCLIKSEEINANKMEIDMEINPSHLDIIINEPYRTEREMQLYLQENKEQEVIKSLLKQAELKEQQGKFSEAIKKWSSLRIKYISQGKVAEELNAIRQGARLKYFVGSFRWCLFQVDLYIKTILKALRDQDEAIKIGGVSLYIEEPNFPYKEALLSAIETKSQILLRLGKEKESYFCRSLYDYYVNRELNEFQQLFMYYEREKKHPEFLNYIKLSTPYLNRKGHIQPLKEDQVVDPCVDLLFSLETKKRQKKTTQLSYSNILILNIITLLPIFFLIDLITGIFTDMSLITFGIVFLFNFIFWIIMVKPRNSNFPSMLVLNAFFLNEIAAFSSFVILRIFNIGTYSEATVTFIFQLFTLLLYFNLVVTIAYLIIKPFWRKVSEDDWGGILAAILITIAVGITLGLFWVLQFAVVFLSALSLVAQLQGDIFSVGKRGISFLKRIWYLITILIQIYMIISYVLNIFTSTAIPTILPFLIGSLYLAVIILIHIRSSINLFMQPFESFFHNKYEIDEKTSRNYMIILLILSFGMLIAVFLGTIDKLIFELSQPYLDEIPLIIGEIPMLSDWLLGTPLFNQELQPALMLIAIVVSFIIINLGKGKIFKFIHGIWKK